MWCKNDNINIALKRCHSVWRNAATCYYQVMSQLDTDAHLIACCHVFAEYMQVCNQTYRWVASEQIYSFHSQSCVARIVLLSTWNSPHRVKNCGTWLPDKAVNCCHYSTVTIQIMNPHGFFLGRVQDVWSQMTPETVNKMIKYIQINGSARTKWNRQNTLVKFGYGHRMLKIKSLAEITKTNGHSHARVFLNATCTLKTVRGNGAAWNSMVKQCLTDPWRVFQYKNTILTILIFSL